jgi:hypothetical protein
MRADDAMRAVAELAASRHGALTRQQAATIDIGRKTIATLKRRGLVDEPVPGVLFVAGAPATYLARLSVATAAGGGTISSHRASASLHGVDDFETAPLEVTVTRGRYPDIPDVVVHRAKRLDPVDVTEIGGIATTSVARMLCDLGAVVDQDTVERALDWALRHGFSERWIREVHERVDRPGPSGTRTLGRILADPRRAGRMPDSWLERIIKRSAEAPDLPRFEVQHEVRDPRTGRLVAVLDGCWVDWRIGVEGHSKAFHGFGQKREWTDLVRDNAVKRLGYELIYVTWDLAHRPGEILTTARDIHAARTGSAARPIPSA